MELLELLRRKPQSEIAKPRNSLWVILMLNVLQKTWMLPSRSRTMRLREL